MLKALATNAPCQGEVANGVEYSKPKHGLNNGNFGSIVEFEMSKKLCVIAWNDFLTACDNGTQAWSDQINSRSACSTLSIKCHYANALASMLRDFHLDFLEINF